MKTQAIGKYKPGTFPVSEPVFPPAQNIMEDGEFDWDEMCDGEEDIPFRKG